MPLRHPYRKWTAKDGCYSACMLEIEIINDPAGYKQSHDREDPRWEIFTEQELRFGLDLGLAEKKWG